MTTRRLSATGKEKLKRFAAVASSVQDFEDVEAALDTGKFNADLIHRLNLVTEDFESRTAATPPLAPPMNSPALSLLGLQKVRQAILAATDHAHLDLLQTALTSGDVACLRDTLGLLPSDMQLSAHHPSSGVGAGDEVAETPAWISTLDDFEDSDDDEYDPFGAVPASPSLLPVSVVASPAHMEASPLVCTKIFGVATSPLPCRPPLPPGPPPQAPGSLGALQSAYDGSSSSDSEPTGTPAEKRRRECNSPTNGISEDAGGSKELPWPLEWAWLLSRSMGNPDFRPPARTDETLAATKSVESSVDCKKRLVAVGLSLVYVGDALKGYDPRHVGRVVVVDEQGQTLLDSVVRPRMRLLDCREHLTGLTREALSGPAAVDFDSVQGKLLNFLSTDTLVVGYKLAGDLESLLLWHGPLVDVSFLFAVDSRKKHQYHSLRYLASSVLGAPVDEDTPLDALEVATISLKLAQHEAQQKAPTPAIAPKAGNRCELTIRHIPRQWGNEASARIQKLLPGARQGAVVNWLLSDSDPSEWRGSAKLVFPSPALCDAAFHSLVGLTDVQVQWDDKPNAPPLGAFLTEQALIKTFSVYGVVVCARIPRRPTTREPQSFAFISFADGGDAERAARVPEVEVQLTETWTLSLKPRLAKYGHTHDKRVAVQSSADGNDDWASDWIHVSRTS